MESITGKEKGLLQGSMQCIVASKLSQREQNHPVILLIIDIIAQVLLHCCIASLHLSFCLQMTS